MTGEVNSESDFSEFLFDPFFFWNNFLSVLCELEDIPWTGVGPLEETKEKETKPFKLNSLSPSFGIRAPKYKNS